MEHDSIAPFALMLACTAAVAAIVWLQMLMERLPMKWILRLGGSILMLGWLA